jgi:acyl-CoA synthetase (AMP-forming)/AMP-acid ligase II
LWQQHCEVPPIDDAATVDDDGFFYRKDRNKNMIISGVENTYPPEVEAILSSRGTGSSL